MGPETSAFLSCSAVMNDQSGINNGSLHINIPSSDGSKVINQHISLSQNQNGLGKSPRSNTVAPSMLIGNHSTAHPVRLCLDTNTIVRVEGEGGFFIEKGESANAEWKHI